MVPYLVILQRFYMFFYKKWNSLCAWTTIFMFGLHTILGMVAHVSISHLAFRLHCIQVIIIACADHENGHCQQLCDHIKKISHSSSPCSAWKYLWRQCKLNINNRQNGCLVVSRNPMSLHHLAIGRSSTWWWTSSRVTGSDVVPDAS